MFLQRFGHTFHRLLHFHKLVTTLSIYYQPIRVSLSSVIITLSLLDNVSRTKASSVPPYIHFDTWCVNVFSEKKSSRSKTVLSAYTGHFVELYDSYMFIDRNSMLRRMPLTTFKSELNVYVHTCLYSLLIYIN